MVRSCILFLLAAVALGITPARGALITPEDKNFLVLSHALVIDQLHLAAFHVNPDGGLITGEGFLTSTAWQGTVSGVVLGLPVNLTYDGIYNSALDTVTWTGVGTYGLRPWSTSGRASFAPDNTGTWQQSGYIEDGDGYDVVATLTLTTDADFFRWRLNPGISVVQSEENGQAVGSLGLGAFYDIEDQPGGTTGRISGGEATLGIPFQRRFVEVTGTYDGERDLPFLGHWLVTAEVKSNVTPEPPSVLLVVIGMASFLAYVRKRRQRKSDPRK